jgi:RNA polymerase sigma-70 factor (ECF subfamily)
MPEDPEFRALLARIRAGDQEAAADLLRRYEPQVRRLIRVRLTDPQLRRVFDSADIFQSVLGKFFVKVLEGRYDPQEPGELLRLLATMASHKIIDQARKPGHRKAEPRGGDLIDRLPGQAGTPSSVVAFHELLDQVASRLSEEELRIARLRADGKSWAEVAAEVGGEPDAVRKRFERAVQRVRERLEAGGPDHG